MKSQFYRSMAFPCRVLELVPRGDEDHGVLLRRDRRGAGREVEQRELAEGAASLHRAELRADRRLGTWPRTRGAWALKEAFGGLEMEEKSVKTARIAREGGPFEVVHT